MNTSLGCPTITRCSLVCTDAIAFAISLGVASEIGGFDVNRFAAMWPFLLAFVGLCQVLGLYSIVAMQPAVEFRRCLIASGLFFLALAGMSVTLNDNPQLALGPCSAAGILCAALMPAMRTEARRLFSNKTWWGYPAVVFGTGHFANRLTEKLRNDPSLGLKIVGVFEHTANVEEAAAILKGKQGYALITPNTSKELTDRCRAHFSHVLVMPSLGNFGVEGSRPRSLGVGLGIELSRG